jgi:hypothetical protein
LQHPDLRTWVVTGWYAGERAYEGLTYYATATGTGGLGTTTGVIYEGDPPPMTLPPTD